MSKIDYIFYFFENYYVFPTSAEQTANSAQFYLFCILLRHVVFLRRKVDRKIYKSVMRVHTAAACLCKAND